jgi:AraC-like DNA-binding protein
MHALRCARDFPTKNHEFTPTSTNYCLTTMEPINLALQALTENPSKTFTKVAREFGVSRSTLSRRARRVTDSRAKRNEEACILLY